MDVVDEVFTGKGKIAVYGLGYVGLALVAVFLRKNLKVIGVDINEKKLADIKELKLSKVLEAEIYDALKKGLNEGNLELTSDLVLASRNSRIKVVTVPVGFDLKTKKISYSSLLKAVRAIGEGLNRGDLVIIESSVPPGTTEEVVKPELEKVSGLSVEEDFYLAYSPERIYVGRAVKDIEVNYPKIVSGIGPKSLDLISKFYSRIVKKGIIKMSSTKAAEFEKLAEGIYRDVNIALANELALMSMVLGIDYYEVRRAANSQPYCHLHLPGPGVGGPCIPVYPYFVVLKVLSLNFVPELTRLARKINESMPYVVVNILVDSVVKFLGTSISKCKIAILGDAFRGNIDDTRYSPTHDIVALLKARGCNSIIVHDPYVKYDETLKNLGVKLVNSISEALKNSDVVLIATRHGAYEKLRISEIIRLSGKEPLIVDTVSVVVRDIPYDRLIILGTTPTYLYLP